MPFAANFQGGTGVREEYENRLNIKRCRRLTVKKLDPSEGSTVTKIRGYFFFGELNCGVEDVGRYQNHVHKGT